MLFFQYLVSWSKSQPLSFWVVLVQWVGFSVYFTFVNAYVASLFLALFVGYFSASLITMYTGYVKGNHDKKISSR